jgi:DNA topoisomerase IB
LRRSRRGRGFVYLDEQSRRIEDPETLARLRSLAIPPAWEEVWICPDPNGHLQATGIDVAGRKQYLYHSRWREHRDRQKFAKALRFGASLPKLRRRVVADLAGDALCKEQVLACAARLLDVGMFRIGSEEYADEDGGLGLATIRRDHVSVRQDAVEFNYPSKGGARRLQVIEDPLSHGVLSGLKRRRGGGEELLVYRNRRRWHPLRSEEINDYLKRSLGEDFSAKDFRTWNATVMAAVSLARADAQATSKSSRKRVIDSAVRDVAELLGNTPAVARRAYIDPRVFDRYLSGSTIADALEGLPPLAAANDRARRRIERAVLGLLEEPNGPGAGTGGKSRR